MGGVMYWMITGEKPMEAPARLKEDTMVPVREMARERFSPTFLAAVDWALQTDEDKRPRTVAEFRAALTGQLEIPAATPASAAAPAIEEKPKASKKSLMAVWVGLAILGIAAAGFAVRHFVAVPAAVPTPAQEPVAEAAKSVAQPTKRQAATQKASAQEVSAPAATKPASKPAVEERKRVSVSQPAQSSPTAKLTFKVVPYGEVYLDGKKIGRTPPLTELPVSAGKHKLEIHGDAMPFVASYLLELKAGETKQIWTKFGND
jgi:hypothetical protein